MGYDLEHTAWSRRPNASRVGRLQDPQTSTTRKAKEALLPFVSDLHDIRTLLGTELTVNGVGAAKQTIEKTQDKGAAVRDALTTLTHELNRIEPSFVLARSAAEPAAAGTRGMPALRR